MSLPVPTDVEFAEWLQHPVTQYVKQMFERRRDELRRQWESGLFTDYEKDGTILVNVGNMGTCKGYAAFTEISYEDIETELDDGERKRIEAPRGGSTD